MTNFRITSPLVIGTALLLGACGGDAPSPHMLTLAEEREPANARSGVMLRIPDRNGQLRVHRLPGLQEANWRLPLSRQVRQTVGFSGESEAAYLLTTDSLLIEVDLRTGLTRTLDSSVAMATVGPDERVYAVMANGYPASLNDRTLTPWARPVRGRAVSLHPAQSSRLIVESVVDSQRLLTSHTLEGDPRGVVVPEGILSLSRWADVAAVADGSDIVIAELRSGEDPRRVAMSGTVLDVAVTPSGHRVLALVSGSRLVTIERFALELLGDRTLPGDATSMRVSENGRMLFLRQASSDSVWVLDLARDSLVGSVVTEWDESTPATAVDGSIVVRSGSSLRVLNPADLSQRAVIEGFRSEHIILAEWVPATPVRLRQDETTTAQETLPEGAELYVQVSSSRNAEWAEDNSQRMRAAGMPARVIAPQDDDGLYRVVLGPYRSRDEAEAAGRQLGRPFWIFSPQEQEEDKGRVGL